MPTQLDLFEASLNRLKAAEKVAVDEAAPPAEKLDATFARLTKKYLAILQFDGPPPRWQLKNNLGPKWLGRCVWAPSMPETCTILVQKIATTDPRTLERVAAHELCHHAEFLGGVATFTARYGAGPPDKVMRFVSTMMRAQASHAEPFLAGAAKVNAVMGKDFVTVKSDESYATSETGRPFYVLVGPISPGSVRIGWAWSARLSDEAVRYVQLKVGKQGFKILRSRDTRLTNTNARIRHGGGLALANDARLQEDVARLYRETPTLDPDTL